MTRRTLFATVTTAICLISAVAAHAQQPHTVRHSLGFSATLPTGWSATEVSGNFQLTPPAPQPQEVFVLATGEAEGVTSITDPRVARLAEQQMAEALPFLRRTGATLSLTTGLGTAVRFAWEGRSPVGVEIRLVTFVALHRSQAVILLGLGERSRIESREADMQRIIAAMKPETATPANPTPASSVDNSPIARQWHQRLNGKKLTVMSGYSSGNSGGFNSRYDMVLQTNGTFTYSGSSSVSIYVPGVSGSSAGTQSASGQWKIISRDGVPYLHITITQGDGRGQQGEFRLTSDSSGKTFLNGTRTFVTDP